MRDVSKPLECTDSAPTAAVLKNNLKAIEVRAARCTAASANAETRMQYLDFRRQYVNDVGCQLAELDQYANLEPMEALRYLLSRVRRMVSDIDASEFVEEGDKALVDGVQNSYDALIRKFGKIIGVDVLDSVFTMFDLGNKEFALRYYIAVIRSYHERSNQGIFGGSRVKKRIHEIHEQYGMANHVAIIQIGAKLKDYEQEIIPFLESMMRSEQLDDGGRAFELSPDELDEHLRSLQTQLVKLRNRMFEIGFYTDE